jgi:voltage-gated potassium channel
MTLKERAWRLLEVEQTADGQLHYDLFDWFILALIFLNVLAGIFGTVAEVERPFGFYLYAFEVFSVGVFTVEYLARLWACTVVPRYARPVWGRLRFAFSPLALIDLFAILPFYLPLLGVDLRFVRVFRLARLFRVAKLGRYVDSLHLFGRIWRAKREELLVSLVLWAFLLIASASLMYYAEHDAQPEAFPNIPATMWWAVMTLTTVGYGDVYPISTAGRLIGAFVAVLGIGLFALPTAILGSGFIEAIQERKRKRVCPHCGQPLE